MKRIIAQWSKIVVLVLAVLWYTVGFGSRVAWAGPHFFPNSTSVTLETTGVEVCDLTATFRECGVGNGDITVTLSAGAATAGYACKNNGGNFHSDPKKQRVNRAVSAGGTFQPRNGCIMGSLTIEELPSTLACPGGQSPVLTCCAYSNMSLTDDTNMVAASVSSGPASLVTEPAFASLCP